MISTRDGSRTLEASLTVGDAAVGPAEAFQKAQQRLFNLVFCGGQAGLADAA